MTTGIGDTTDTTGAVKAPQTISEADLRVVTYRLVASLIREAIDNGDAAQQAPASDGEALIDRLENFASWARCEANYAIGHAHIHGKPCRFLRDDDIAHAKVP